MGSNDEPEEPEEEEEEDDKKDDGKKDPPDLEDPKGEDHGAAVLRWGTYTSVAIGSTALYFSI